MFIAPNKPLLTLNVVWHPAFSEGKEIAEYIYDHYRRDLFENVVGGTGLSVLYRSQPPISRHIPIDINFDDSQTTAVIALMDRHLIEDSNWVRYIEELAQKAKRSNLKAMVFPIAVDRAAMGVGTLIRQLNFVRWCDWEDSHKPKLSSALSYEFCRMLRSYLALLEHPSESESTIGPYLKKVEIFLSHSKHDQHGRQLAQEIRDHIYNNTIGLGSFFDVHDIPAGLPFAEVLNHYLKTSAVIAIHTDSYSSREWCRREILGAKRNNVPLIVAHCITDFEERGFPYLGNVPVIRIDHAANSRTELLISRLLDEVLKDYLWRCRTQVATPPESTDIYFLPRPPELVSLATLPAPSLSKGDFLTLVYPDPPLGVEEAELFQTISPHVEVKSYTEWAAHDIGSPVADTFLEGKKIAVSISESPDCAFLGLDERHLKDVLVEIGRHLLVTGCHIFYGGDLRTFGFTELLLELLIRHYKDSSGNNGAFTNFLPWPVHMNLTAETLQEKSKDLPIGVRLECLDIQGQTIPIKTRLNTAPTQPEETDWNTGLLAMRKAITGQSDARIILGGRLNGFKGNMPGIAEEALVTLQQGKPLFVLAGFGGCAYEIATLIGLIVPHEYVDARDWPHKADFSEFNIHNLNNGLTDEENRQLAHTVHSDEAVTLILKGLYRLADKCEE